MKYRCGIKLSARFFRSQELFSLCEGRVRAMPKDIVLNTWHECCT